MNFNTLLNITQAPSNMTPFNLDDVPDYARVGGPVAAVPPAAPQQVRQNAIQPPVTSAPRAKNGMYAKWAEAEQAMRHNVASDPALQAWAAGRLSEFRRMAGLGYTVLKNLPGMKYPGKWKGAEHQITAASAAALTVNEGFCVDNTAIKSVQNLGILCGPVNPDGSGGGDVCGIDVDVKGVAMPPRPAAMAPWAEVYPYLTAPAAMSILRDQWKADFRVANPSVVAPNEHENQWQYWLMKCMIVLTPSGGFHLYTRVEGDDCGMSVSAGKTKGDDGSVIDIRWTSATGKVGQLAGPTSRTIDEVDHTGAITKRGGEYITIWGDGTPAATLAVIPDGVKAMLAGSAEDRARKYGSAGLRGGEQAPTSIMGTERESAIVLGSKLMYFNERWDEEVANNPAAVDPRAGRSGAYFSVMMALASAVRLGTGVTFPEAAEAFEAYSRADAAHFDQEGLEAHVYQLEQAADSHTGPAITPATIHAMAENWRHIFSEPATLEKEKV